MREAAAVKRPVNRSKSRRRRGRANKRLFLASALIAALIWLLWWAGLRARAHPDRRQRHGRRRPFHRARYGAKPLVLVAFLLATAHLQGAGDVSGMSGLPPSALPHLWEFNRVGITVDAAHLDVALSGARSLVLATAEATAVAPTPVPPPATPSLPPALAVATPPPAPQVVVTPAPSSAVAGAVSGIATWYGGVDGFDLGDGMADGTPFNPDDPTIAASNHWPLGTHLLVCHAGNCITVVVRDRGAFHHALDLSRAAFACLAPLSKGVISVTIQVIP